LKSSNQLNEIIPTELSTTSTEDTIMAITFVNVSTYSVFAYSGPQASGLRAMIYVSLPKATAQLRFYQDNTTIPNNTYINPSSASKVYVVNYPYYQYAGLLDLLRNEKPIMFSFNEGNGEAYITTSDEPVGEGE
jgi:hypothetical protein